MTTMLHEILPRYTQMPVELITERLAIQPDHVFIIPEQRDLHVLDGEFRLKPISKPRGWPDVITVFLRSLTQHWNGKLIAVIVSGYDGDGAAALCGIKEVGGITIAQKPLTARQPDMPESAIASGVYRFCSFHLRIFLTKSYELCAQHQARCDGVITAMCFWDRQPLKKCEGIQGFPFSGLTGT